VSGTVTLQAPAVSGTTTLTLPTANGTILTTGTSTRSIPAAAMPAGSILQVINSAYSTITSSTSSTFANLGLSASITPLSSTSKILIIVSLNGINKSSVATCTQTQLLRGVSVISYIDTIIGYTNSAVTSTSSASINYLDSPATTSATTYSIQFANQAAVGTVTINNYTGALNTVSTMTLMEIAQ
jgi:hypothetical protein